MSSSCGDRRLQSGAGRSCVVRKMEGEMTIEASSGEKKVEVEVMSRC